MLYFGNTVRRRVCVETTQHGVVRSKRLCLCYLNRDTISLVTRKCISMIQYQRNVFWKLNWWYWQNQINVVFTLSLSCRGVTVLIRCIPSLMLCIRSLALCGRRGRHAPGLALALPLLPPGDVAHGLACLLATDHQPTQYALWSSYILPELMQSCLVIGFTAFAFAFSRASSAAFISASVRASQHQLHIKRFEVRNSTGL